MAASHRVLKQYTDSTALANEITTAYSDVIDMRQYEHLAIEAISDVNTPAAATFTAATTDICTATAHGFTTGLKVQVSSDTTLPAGLSAATDYFIVVLTANTFKFSDTLAHALAGTDLIDITDTGTGVHTVTPTALAGASIILQKSNDGTTFTDVGSVDNITADETNWYEITNVLYAYARLKFTCTAGRVSTTLNIVIRG